MGKGFKWNTDTNKYEVGISSVAGNLLSLRGDGLYYVFSAFDDDLRTPKGSIYVGGVRDANYIAFDYQGEVPAVGYKNLRVPIVSWITSDPFPT